MVQRVAPFTMAVKCEKDENHPLGYLHTSFLSASNNSTETGYRFSCTCALVLTFLPTSKNLVKTEQILLTYSILAWENTPTQTCLEHLLLKR